MKIDSYLVRHGETENNKKGVLAGRTDVALTEEGIAHIREMLQDHPFPQPDVVYISPLKRCLETANLVFPEYMNANKPRTEENLIEMDFGQYEGKPVKAFADDEKLYEGWRNQRADVGLTGGETFGEVEQRAVKAIDRIIEFCEAEQIKTVGIVSHNMVIVQLLRNHMTVELRPEDRFCPNGMGFHLKIDTEQWKTERKMEFVKPLPVGAKRPSPSDSPYVNIR